MDRLISFPRIHARPLMKAVVLFAIDVKDWSRETPEARRYGLRSTPYGVLYSNFTRHRASEPCDVIVLLSALARL